MTLRFAPVMAATLVLATLSIGTDTAWAKRRRGPPDVVEDALAFATTDRAKAVELLEGALASGPSSRDIDVVMVHAGEQRRLSGDLAKAREWFTQVADNTRKGGEHDSALLGLALIEVEEGADGVLPVLQSVPDKDVLATINADRYLHLTIAAARRDDAGKVASYSKKALSHAKEDPAVLERITATLQALAGVAPEDVDEALAGRGTPYDKALVAYEAGDLDLARKWAQKADDEPRAQGMLRVLDGAPVRGDLVVALLPLSGKYEAVGNHVRDALEFGWGDAGGRITFVDSGATPESAVTALEEAVLDDGAIAVIGPLLSDETEAVVDAAESLHVPLISLSQSYEDTSEAHWALQAMYTRADQVEALLDHAMGPAGMQAFAVFSPDNEFGTHAVELFQASLQERGGKITTQATYAAGEQNLLPFAKELGVREGNLRELREEAEQRGGNPDTVVLPPRIDFDAIFLPDSADRTPLACAALAYEEFPMGEFVPTRESPEIPLLGLSTWNTESLVTQGNEYTRNSLFPDVFSAPVAGDEDPFVMAYRDATGRTPSALEAAVVDAGKLVGAAASTGPEHRGAFRAALLAAQVDDAVTGATGFDPETLKAKRKMQILTITRETIEKVGEVEL